jgi:hypothetical protein
MEKRRIILGTYNTARDGLWTLRSWKLTKPKQVQNFLAVPGRHAPLDYSTYMTDGQPYYESRSWRRCWRALRAPAWSGRTVSTSW